MDTDASKPQRGRPRGRPRELTPALLAEIEKLLRVGGCYFETVAAMAGVSSEAFRKWQRRGEKALKMEKRGEEIPESEQIFADLVGIIKTALAEFEFNLIGDIRIAGQKNWTALAWIAERRFSDRWSKPSPEAVNPTTAQAQIPTLSIVVSDEVKVHRPVDDSEFTVKDFDSE